MLRVGLTGGIASGKSTVSAMLAELGAVVVDADALAREVVEPGTPGLAAVVAEFGPEVLTPDGRLDRARLGAVVFADTDARRRLEALTHPLVRRRTAELVAAADDDDVVVLDNPLLVEMGLHRECDVVVVVDVPEDVQVARMVADRGMSEDDARARIAAQTSRAARAGVADRLVDNTGPVAELRARVEEVWQDLRRRAAG